MEYRPVLKLKIDLEIPDPFGAPSKKFSVSRTLKARWCDDPSKVTFDILSEIKNYKGSFIGDTIKGLNGLFRSEGKPIKENTSRMVDVAKWSANILDLLIFSSIKDEIHKEFINNKDIAEWDGTFRKIDPVNVNEIKEIDIEKVMILLAPKLKHALFLISKDLQKNKI